MKTQESGAAREPQPDEARERMHQALEECLDEVLAEARLQERRRVGEELLREVESNRKGRATGGGPLDQGSAAWKALDRVRDDVRRVCEC